MLFIVNTPFLNINSSLTHSDIITKSHIWLKSAGTNSNFTFMLFTDIDMSGYNTYGLLDRYGRLYRNGHLQLFRNTEDVKYFVLHSLNCSVLIINIVYN